MLDLNSQTPHPHGLLGPFSSIFDQSRIPMCLIDHERRYVKVNDALVNFYEYPREQLLGRTAESMMLDGREGLESRWEELVRTNQLYGERIIAHANGTPLRIAYGAHATTLEGRWFALIVVLSARPHEGGPELIGSVPVESPAGLDAKLTAREREVVKLVALGSTTRQVAADLSLSPETIRSHVRNAMAKTGAHTRAQLVALVLANHVVED